MTRVSLRLAITAIEDHCSIYQPALLAHPEWKAIVTHWLHDPLSIPTFCTATDRDEWQMILSVLNLDRNSSKNGGPSIDLPFISHNDIPFPPPEPKEFTFVDLFAGIGGFRIALQELGGRCVFSSEWDKAAKNTYFENYGEVPFGDIRQFTNEKLSNEEIDNLIPDHNVLAAGFPCQPFSLAGVSARQALGRATGFACETQGTCFWDIVRIADIKRPEVLILENVKNLRSHDGGRTFDLIRKTIEVDLNYSFSEQVIDARTLVPQHRERCYMVCFSNREIGFEFPKLEGEPLPLKTILETDQTKVAGFTISDRLWQGHQSRTSRNLARGTGFTAYLANPDKPSNTLVARYGKDGKECLVPQGPGMNPRMLTPSECAKLQGFPGAFILPKTKAPAYRQFGNSVAVPVVRKIAEMALSRIRRSAIAATSGQLSS